MSLDDLHLLAADLATAGQTGRPLKIDLAEPPPATGAAYDVDVVIAVAGLLLTDRAAAAPVHVLMPSATSQLIELASGGFLFALAQRSPAFTTIDWSDAAQDMLGEDPSMLRQLRHWQRDWRPSNLEYRQMLLDPPLPEESAAHAVSVVQDRFICFLNPHRTSRSRVNAELTHNLALPWIARLLLGSLDLDDQPLLNDVTAVLDEALDNLVDYGFEGACGEQRSFVNIYVTEAHGLKGHAALNLLICDFGVGIPATLRPKLIRDHDTLDIDLVARALEGRLAYNHNRGKGLPGIANIVAAHNAADITVMTATPEGFVMTTGRDGAYRPQEVSAPYAGTAVRVMIPLRAPVAKAEVQHPQLELQQQ